MSTLDGKDDSDGGLALPVQILTVTFAYVALMAAFLAQML